MLLNKMNYPVARLPVQSGVNQETMYIDAVDLDADIQECGLSPEDKILICRYKIDNPDMNAREIYLYFKRFWPQRVTINNVGRTLHNSKTWLAAISMTSQNLAQLEAMHQSEIDLNNKQKRPEVIDVDIEETINFCTSNNWTYTFVNQTYGQNDEAKDASRQTDMDHISYRIDDTKKRVKIKVPVPVNMDMACQGLLKTITYIATKFPLRAKLRDDYIQILWQILLQVDDDWEKSESDAIISTSDKIVDSPEQLCSTNDRGYIVVPDSPVYDMVNAQPVMGFRRDNNMQYSDDIIKDGEKKNAAQPYGLQIIPLLDHDYNKEMTDVPNQAQHWCPIQIRDEIQSNDHIKLEEETLTKYETQLEDEIQTIDHIKLEEETQTKYETQSEDEIQSFDHIKSEDETEKIDETQSKVLFSERSLCVDEEFENSDVDTGQPCRMFKDFSEKYHVIDIDRISSSEDSEDEIERQYSCDICYQVFFGPVFLFNHKLTKHENEAKKRKLGRAKKHSNTFKISKTENKTPTEKDFVCRTCLLIFSNQSEFNQHVELHLDEVIYKCPMCAELFPSTFTLEGHIDSHS